MCKILPLPILNPEKILAAAIKRAGKKIPEVHNKSKSQSNGPLAMPSRTGLAATDTHDDSMLAQQHHAGRLAARRLAVIPWLLLCFR
jgi:hypothetical protein